MPAYKNIVIAGASGSLGSKILNALLAAGTFNITVLSREDSTATFPASVHVIKVNYDSIESLTASMKNQDVVIAALTTMASGTQLKMIDAAFAAGVKRFLPGEFGSNLEHPATRALPVFQAKVEVSDYVVQKAQENKDFTYTMVTNGALLDWGLEYNFIFNHAESKPEIWNGGDWKWSTTTMTSVADAVVGIMNHPAETANQVVYIQDMLLSQNQILEIAKRLTPDRQWEPKHLALSDAVADSYKKLEAGDYGFATFAPFIFQAAMGEGYGNQFEKLDNELLGVKGKTLADVEDLLRPLLAGGN